MVKQNKGLTRVLRLPVYSLSVLVPAVTLPSVVFLLFIAQPLLLFGAPPGQEPFSVLGRYRLTCPVCGQGFTAVSCAQTNTRGGLDRDLFARALGPQPEFYRIATCPKCGYSGYDADFDPAVALAADFRDRILVAPKLKLPAGFGPASDARDLDAADRYELAITCYQWRQKSDESIGWLHLRASWVAREEGAVLPEDERLARVFKFAERWRPVLSAGDNQADGEMRVAAQLAEAELSGRFNRYQRPYVELASALLLRRHGENRQAAAILERLAAHNGFSQALLDGASRMKTSIEKERRHQAQAAECFERALLAKQIPEPNRSVACYLQGELNRRLGHAQDAVHWYDLAMADHLLPANLREWATQQRAECIRPGPD